MSAQRFPKVASSISLTKCPFLLSFSSSSTEQLQKLREFRRCLGKKISVPYPCSDEKLEKLSKRFPAGGSNGLLGLLKCLELRRRHCGKVEMWWKEIRVKWRDEDAFIGKGEA